MGYGGSRKDAGEAMGKSGDGGIDGIIKEDKLGLDIIYLQAKRWDNVVPVKEIRDFTGALASKKAKKGIFISDRKSTRLNSSHVAISYAVFCLKKKTHVRTKTTQTYKTAI